LADAPVVIAAFGHPGECAEAADPPLPNSRRARLTSRDASSGQQRLKAHLQRLPPQVWIHRHAMLACTCMMLTAQSLGWDTALVDRFDPAAVAAALALPAETEVVALLAIGHAATAEAPPPEDRELGQIAFSEQFGERWPG
jgi:nitroreductase